MIRSFTKRVRTAHETLSRCRPTAAQPRGHAARLRFEPLESRLVLGAGPLIISEFLAINDALVLDGDDDSSDWIEIHNPTAEAINLAGWHLTDDADDLTRWEFPAVTIPPGEYLVVFASGKDRADPAELHTNFKLSGDGEYLALVRADGTTVAHDFGPEYPQQMSNVSYGLGSLGAAWETLSSSGAGGRHHVPSSGEDPLAWTAASFDDSAWAEAAPVVASGLMVTEVGTGSIDWFEIQNVTDGTLDTAGWIVVVNQANAGPSATPAVVWQLPDAVAPQEVLYRTDNVGDNYYYGFDWFWRTTGTGWVMIVDDQGNVADFLGWGYSEADIASMDVSAGGFENITVGKQWHGEGAPRYSERNTTMQRTGDADNNVAEDFAWSADTQGEQNVDLMVPFGGFGATPTALGFSDDKPEFDRIIQTDLGEAMQGVNASLWNRIEFRCGDPSKFDELTLRMKYDDGFVAYLNGTEVARRNAPHPLVHDSSATAAHPDSLAVVFEEIDISEHLLGSLQSGNNVLAIHGLNVDAADDDFLIQFELTAKSELGDAKYMSTPTPGLENTEGALGWVADTKFSVDRGFYSEPLEVEITTETEGAEIRFTTDGSTPAEENGTVYSGPITIDTTTTLRAAAFKLDYIPTNVDTHTYLFLDDVVRQTGAGFPNTWGYNGADYEMDPEVVNAALPIDSNDEQFTVQDALAAVPTLSLVMNTDDWFGGGNRRGIYVQGEHIQRAASAELMYADGTEGFQINASIEIVGGSSVNRWKMDKLSMRLKFQEPYGPVKLNFPLFGDEATDRFDTIVVDARMNQTWAYGGGSSPSYQREHAQYTRDQFVSDIQRATGGYAPHGVSAHLYLNGLYWGMYRLHERPDEHFGVEYLGGNDEDYYVMKHNSGTAINGDRDARDDYNAMFSVANAGLGGEAQYEAIQEYLDIPDFIDYMITNFYVGNTDWAHQNWYATRSIVDPDGRWRYHSWDPEHSMKSITENVTGKDNNGGPTRLHQRLAANAEYRMLFADHLQEHFFNDGVLTPENVAALYQIRLDEIDRAVVAESARWGDNHSSTPFTRDPHWLTERDRILDDYFPVRTGIVLEQLRNRNLYPSVEAPEYSQHGGEVDAGFGVEITAPSGTIYYTLDGSDPRLSGGGLSPDAQVFGGAPVALNSPTLVRARARVGNEWSAVTEAAFLIGRPAAVGDLAITEINYNPYDPTAKELAVNPDFQATDFEFIELLDTHTETIDVSHLRFTAGVSYTLPVAELAPGERAVVVNNLEAFEARYGTETDGTPIRVLGQYRLNLGNDGNRIVLRDRYGETIADFKYGDSGNWPGRADGKGASLELIDPTAVPPTDPQRADYLSDGDQWRSSGEYGGSPAVAGSGPVQGVVINEVLTHTDPPMIDAIELANTTDAPIDVGGWYLSDSWGWESSEENGNYKKFRIDDGTTIDAHGYLVFDEGHFNPSGGDPQGDPNDFALNSAHGDDVWLMKGDAAGDLTRFVDHVQFGAAIVGESFGRWPNLQGDLVPMTSRTLDGANSGPRVGPVVISELMYHPPDPGGEVDSADVEFIEIYNPTGQAVDLTNWRIRDGVDFSFADGTMLGPSQTLVVLPFDPQRPGNATKLAYFRAYYEIDASVPLVGGFSGRLENVGERVQLQRPDQSPPEEPGFIPRLLEDEVDYDNDDPWPTHADGGGHSLQRLAADAWGNDAASWASAMPTPGTVDGEPAASVSGRYVFYNNSAFDDAAGGLTDDDAIAPDKEALLSGQKATFVNYTSYVRGINGVMVDVAGLADAGQLDASDDFEFKVGNDNNPDRWPAAPAPQTVAVRPGAGVDGSDRVTIIWADGAIARQWLQVTVRATDHTGLAEDDVFYFGNAIGEAGNSTLNAIVNTTDEAVARNFQHGPANLATIDDPYDYNRDRFVNTTDRTIARTYQTGPANALRLIIITPVDGGLGGGGQAAVNWTEAGLGELDWLDELETTGTPARSSSEDPEAVQQVVDMLLADYWA